ncbi:MAG: hypothetical protein M1834_003159 [Cirrosporium novae-zelandiae]|nr:MAG: hypothetical protein M1834_003159 [Cirrosporium novae-zelandiae]
MHPLKFSYDELGEKALERLNVIAASSSRDYSSKDKTLTDAESENSTFYSSSNSPTSIPPSSGGKLPLQHDLYVLLQTYHATDSVLSELWYEVHTIPYWVDWQQIDRGQEVFYRYGGPALTGLAYQSLLGGMGANRVVETLSRTGGFSVKAARRRLYETTQYILECTKSLGSIQPGGAGMASSVRVRLLHAAVRQRIMKLASQRPSYYSVKDYGIPINDLDSIATIGTFSATLVWLSFPRQGIFLRQQEIEDYIALWRLVAHYTGTPTSYFSSPEKARAIMESLLVHEISPTSTSRILASNILTALENQPPTYSSRGFLVANARWLNGNELCDELSLGHASSYYWALVAGQCIFFCVLCYTHRTFSFLDRRKIATVRRIFWNIIVQHENGLGGQPSFFEFKYVPQFDTSTYKGVPEEPSRYMAQYEKRNLKVLFVAIGVTVLGVWITVFLTTSMWKALWSLG